MKAPSDMYPAKALTLAVRAALLILALLPAAQAAEAIPPDAAGAPAAGTPDQPAGLDPSNPEVIALTRQHSQVEGGAIYVSKDSFKFGEYNGLQDKGVHVDAGLDLRGGGEYDGDATRWRIEGSNLGLDTRALSAEYGRQGNFRFTLGYDKLRHNTDDSFQTPFQGSPGGNSFTLPNAFGVINTAAPGSRGLNATQLASFHTEEVHNDRENTSFSARYDFNPGLQLQFDFNHLEQSGAKVFGVGGDKFAGGGDAAFSWIGQTPQTILNPTNYTTNTANLALNWVGEQAHVSASYFGSLFRDDYNGVSWNNPFINNPVVANVTSTGVVPSAFPTDTISTFPGNDFHQLNVTGGYTLGPTTKLAGGFSYSRNTQNEAYAPVNTYVTASLPKTSLDGLVVNTHADLRLTDQTTRKLGLSAAITYNERDNKTESNSYQHWDINQTPTLANPNANSSLSVNTPMSHRKTQVELAGDYRIDTRQKVRLAYEYEQLKRWCNNAAANNAQGIINAQSAVPAGWYVATTCAQVLETQENKLAADYRLRTGESVSLNAGYAYSRRKADVSPSFYNPIQTRSGDPATPNAAAPHAEGFEVPGFLDYSQASRKQQVLKAGVDWQAGEKLNIGLNGRYTDDDYDSEYGVRNGKSWSLNLDATYHIDEKKSVSAYVTTQDMRRDMTNVFNVVVSGAIPPFSTWTNKLHEDDFTAGIGTRLGGLVHNKLVLGGDLTYSLGKTDYGTQLNYTPATACTAATVLTCGDLPTIRYEMLQLKVTGTYQVEKQGKVILGYQYQNLKSADWFYNGLQVGNTPTTLLPSNQQAPRYNVNTVFVAYNYSFR